MKIKDKQYEIITIGLFAAAVIFISVFVLFSDFRDLIFLIPDDSSYYLKIAKNFTDGKGFSFDGIHQTNGFQPLWQYLLLLITFISNTDPETTLRVVLMSQIGILILAATFYYKTLCLYFNQKIILIGSVFFILFVFFQSVNAMETALLVLMLSFLFYFASKKEILTKHDLKNEFMFGIILGLLILTRLDSVFIAAAVCIGTFIRSFLPERKQYVLKELTMIISGALIIVLPYLLYNFKSFHNIIPVSGYLKSSFPEITFKEKITDIIRYRESVFVFFALVYLIWFLIRHKKIRSNNLRNFLPGLAVFSLGILMLYVYVIFFVNWVIFQWYFITYSFFASFAVCIPVDFFYKREIKSLNIIVGTLIFFIFIFWGNKIYKYYTTGPASVGNNWIIESYNASQWAKKNSQLSDIFAMKDAGHFSFYSEREVINLDGLVNNFDFQDVIKNKTLNQYLKDNSVKFLVQHAFWNRDDITGGNYDTLKIKYPSHKYSGESDSLILNKQNEVYRSPPYFDGPYKTTLLIWNMKY